MSTDRLLLYKKIKNKKTSRTFLNQEITNAEEKWSYVVKMVKISSSWCSQEKAPLKSYTCVYLIKNFKVLLKVLNTTKAHFTKCKLDISQGFSECLRYF